MTPARPRLPEHIAGSDGLALRRWRVSDTEALSEAVSTSLEHLRPWMPWVSEEPLALQRRRAFIEEREREWAAGGDVFLGIFLNGQVAGSCGLHRRIAPDGLELGYWVRVGFLRRGIATATASLLTGAALALPGITHVEIHHDKANVASGRVPRRLGFELVGETADGAGAPGEIGIECRWRLDRERWEGRAARARAPVPRPGDPS